jgi:hypothetical protein
MFGQVQGAVMFGQVQGAVMFGQVQGAVMFGQDSLRHPQNCPISRALGPAFGRLEDRLQGYLWRTWVPVLPHGTCLWAEAHGKTKGGAELGEPSECV